MTLSISTFFSPTCETRELHADAELRTRYYRNNFKQCLEAVQTLQTMLSFQVQNVDETHGEVYLLGNGYEVILTITQVNPIETGIDMKINLFGAIGFGKPKKKAIQFYQEFDRLLKFKGVALHP